MVLLFLGLGAASVKAQVRIGGNTAPNASAVLDLNVNDTNNGTKGLALPRVGLTSNTMLLPGVTANLTGMLVYNTTTTGGAGVNTVGIYVWNGAWVRASLPSTSAADTGKLLSYNGSNWQLITPSRAGHASGDTLSLNRNLPTTWSLVLDTNMTFKNPIVAGQYTWVMVPGLLAGDFCLPKSYSWEYVFIAGFNRMSAVSTTQLPTAAGQALGIRCYRPAF